MRILILSFYFRPDLAAGSFRTSALVAALVDKLPPGATIDVITTLPNRYRSFNVQAPAYEQCGPLTVHRIALPPHASGMADQSRAFLSFAAGAFRATSGVGYDLVFATSSRLMTAVLGARIAASTGARLYLDIRDIFVDTIHDVLHPVLARVLLPVLSLLERYAVGRSAHLNLVSEGFRDYFNNRYPRVEASFFTNGIDPEFLGRLTLDGPAKPPSAPMRILYAGNIGEGQGLEQIVPGLAARLGPRAEFTIIGDGGRRERLAQAIAQSGCANVALTPPVNRHELLQAYQGADVLFLHLNDFPAFEKVLPSKIFEYAATGKPIWAGVAGHAAHFIRENVENSAVFSPCNESQALAEFDKLKLGTVPRSQFCEKFSRSGISAAMADDILRLAARSQ